jgi:hypothetical protein
MYPFKAFPGSDANPQVIVGPRFKKILQTIYDCTLWPFSDDAMRGLLNAAAGNHRIAVAQQISSL